MNGPKIQAPDALKAVIGGLEAVASGAAPVGYGGKTSMSSLPAAEFTAWKDVATTAKNLAARIKSGTYTGPLLLEIRGYFLDTVGKPGQNDINVWDDAIIYLRLAAGKVVEYVAIRGNVDPSVSRQRVAFKAAPQLYYVKEGRHAKRRGLRQDSPVLIDRIGPDSVRGMGAEFRQSPGAWPYTNIHDDRGAGTGSLGCSTAPPDEYRRIYEPAKGAGRIPVVLIDETERRKL